MTKENLITVPVGTTLEQAEEILHGIAWKSSWWSTISTT
jgi:hypothetical protein